MELRITKQGHGSNPTKSYPTTSTYSVARDKYISHVEVSDKEEIRRALHTHSKDNEKINSK